MPQRPLHCYLPGCSKPILLARRFRGYWYCCDQHYGEDRERREKSIKIAQGVGGPARCAKCKGRIPWLRYVAGYEYCSGRCYLAHGVIRRSVPASKPVQPTSGGGSMTRPIFIALVPALLLAWFKGEIFKKSAAAAPTAVLPAPRVVSFAREISTWSPDVLKEWIQTSGSSPAWRLDQGGLQILNTLLLGSAGSARGGTLSFVLSLNDAGKARFVLGSNALASQCWLVELASTAASLTLRPLRQTAEGLAEIGELLTIDRGNKNKHTVSIAFSDSSLDVKVNGASRNWPRLGVGPGHVGLSGREEDGFRVYQTGLKLTL